ncbi:MAG TPA: hypothetical protein VMG12_01010 [Polyangiaceae bacterium]|nr:hypothetical protein [Polyangiaceae bacterium]
MTSRWRCLAQVGLPFLWAGLVLGLSFVETPLKFRAPGITRELGLGIGRLVFATLNRIELVLAVAVLLAWWPERRRWSTRGLLAGLGAILLAQTLWLLPVLDARALAMIAGETLVPSSHHVLFVIVEAVKLGLLLALGCSVRLDVGRLDAARP